MRGRFSTTNINILRGVSSLSPESPTFLDLPELKALWLILHCDTVLLNNEIEVLKPMLKQSKSKILLIYILKLYHFNKLFQLLCPQWKIFEKKGTERVPKTIWLFLRKENVAEKLECIPKWKGQEQIQKKWIAFFAVPFLERTPVFLELFLDRYHLDSHLLQQSSKRSEVNIWFAGRCFLVQLDELYPTACSNFS